MWRAAPRSKRRQSAPRRAVLGMRIHSDSLHLAVQQKPGHGDPAESSKKLRQSRQIVGGRREGQVPREVVCGVDVLTLGFQYEG